MHLGLGAMSVIGLGTFKVHWNQDLLCLSFSELRSECVSLQMQPSGACKVFYESKATVCSAFFPLFTIIIINLMLWKCSDVPAPDSHCGSEKHCCLLLYSLWAPNEKETDEWPQCYFSNIPSEGTATKCHWLGAQFSVLEQWQTHPSREGAAVFLWDL